MYKAKEIKSSNHDRILECIYRNPGYSRRDISELTGITPATVTTTVAAMLQEGIVRELGEMEEEKKSLGRKRIALGINEAYGCVVGVEFTAEALTACVTDLAGKILYTTSVPHSREVGNRITGLVIDHIRQCMEAAGDRNILAVGIAVPGHMDEEALCLVSSRSFWKSFDGKKIAEACDCPVFFENNVRCMAVAKYLHDPSNTPSSFALFHVGYGMFCANVSEDELYIGTTYGAGEIAHTVAVPDGKRCSCGQQGCLQTVATEVAILENAAVVLKTDQNTLLRNYTDTSKKLTIEHVIAAYSMGDASVRRLVDQALKYLSISILNIAVIMNPEKLFLHGKMFNDPVIRRNFLEMVERRMDFLQNHYNLGTVEVMKALPTDGAAGAAALAILRGFCHA